MTASTGVREYGSSFSHGACSQSLHFQTIRSIVEASDVVTCLKFGDIGAIQPLGRALLLGVLLGDVINHVALKIVEMRRQLS